MYPISITAKVWITSLNSHFAPLRLSTKYGEYCEVAKVWIKVCNPNFWKVSAEVGPDFTWKLGQRMP